MERKRRAKRANHSSPDLTSTPEQPFDNSFAPLNEPQEGAGDEGIQAQAENGKDVENQNDDDSAQEVLDADFLEADHNLSPPNDDPVRVTITHFLRDKLEGCIATDTRPPPWIVSHCNPNGVVVRGTGSGPPRRGRQLNGVAVVLLLVVFPLFFHLGLNSAVTRSLLRFAQGGESIVGWLLGRAGRVRRGLVRALTAPLTHG